MKKFCEILKEKLYKMFLYLIIPIMIYVVLSFVNKENSIIVSAFLAVIVNLVSPETFGYIFCINIDDKERGKLESIKFFITLIVFIAYIVNIFYPEYEYKNFYEFLANFKERGGVFRVIFAEGIFAIFIFIIYGRPRKAIQNFFEKNSGDLNGNWNYLHSETLIGIDILVRQVFMNIDGNNINYKNNIYSRKDVFSSEQANQKEGISSRNEEIVTLGNGKLVKVGSEVYRYFIGSTQTKNHQYINKLIKDPLREGEEIEVSLFEYDKECNEYHLVNSLENKKYIYQNSKFIEVTDNTFREERIVASTEELKGMGLFLSDDLK